MQHLPQRNNVKKPPLPSTYFIAYLTNGLVDFIELEYNGGYEADKQGSERQRDCYSA